MRAVAKKAKRYLSFGLPFSISGWSRRSRYVDAYPVSGWSTDRECLTDCRSASRSTPSRASQSSTRLDLCPLQHVGRNAEGGVCREIGLGQIHGVTPSRS